MVSLGVGEAVMLNSFSLWWTSAIFCDYLVPVNGVWSQGVDQGNDQGDNEEEHDYYDAL
jgi:hypothetical protein